VGEETVAVAISIKDGASGQKSQFEEKYFPKKLFAWYPLPDRQKFFAQTEILGRDFRL